MRHLDWQMIVFIGTSLLHDYWVFWGLPKVYYYESSKTVYRGERK